MLLINQEQKIIESILKKYELEKPDEELKKKIYKDLMHAKSKGLITIPFKVILRKKNDPNMRDFVEIVIDSKL